MFPTNENFNNDLPKSCNNSKNRFPRTPSFILSPCHFLASVSLRTAARRDVKSRRKCISIAGNYRTCNIIRLRIFHSDNTRPAMAEILLERGTANNIISCLKSSDIRWRFIAKMKRFTASLGCECSITIRVHTRAR